MKRLQVQVCMGTTCYVMGASELKSFREELPEDLIDQVEVVACNCMGHCKDERYGQAPYIKIGDEVVSAATAEGLTLRIRDRLQYLQTEKG